MLVKILQISPLPLLEAVIKSSLRCIEKVTSYGKYSLPPDNFSTTLRLIFHKAVSEKNSGLTGATQGELLDVLKVSMFW